MSKAATLSNAEEQHKAQAKSYLSEAQRIVRQLAADRKREERRRSEPAKIVSEVKAIPQSR